MKCKNFGLTSLQDISAVEKVDGDVQLLCRSVSCAGGISDVLAQLPAECRSLPPTAFQLIQQHIYGMNERITISGRDFSGPDLQRQLVDCYAPGIALVKTVVRNSQT